LRWQPTPGAAWSLPDAAGKAISSTQFTGKPTLVIFYLGYGCPHCMEQVTKFSGDIKKFKDAGIDVVAISTDNVEALQRSLNTDKKIPFPVVSDAKFEAFKAYRVFDDFENQPLHGTFLIDAKGLVRWHDIGYEPFMDTAFVLNEAKRLLALPAPH
jgi:peroxiredoxin